MFKKIQEQSIYSVMFKFCQEAKPHRYKKKRKENLFTWLRKCTSHSNFAELSPHWETGVFAPRPRYTNKQLLDYYHGNSKIKWLYHLTTADYEEHIKGVRTYYCQGNGRAKDPYTLVMIDIDCLKSRNKGSYEGAVAFAEHLKTIYPDLMYEPSTNGNGVHAYFRLYKLNCNAKYVKDRMQGYERFIKQEAIRINADIEGVEIKGMPSIHEYNDDGIVVGIISGTNAKLPRFDCRNTTTIHINDLPYLEKTIQKKDRMPACAGAAGILLQSHHKNGASWCPLFMKEEDRDLDHYRQIAMQYGGHIECTGECIVQIEDEAIALMIWHKHSANMNADGSMPWARTKAMWDALYDNGDISRPFNPNRYAAIRNHYSSIIIEGEFLLDWKDDTYGVGRACKWQASELLMGILNKEVSLAKGAISYIGNYPKPKPDWIIKIDRDKDNDRCMRHIQALYEKKKAA